MWVRNVDLAYLDSLLQSLSKCCNDSDSWARVSPEDSPGERPTCVLTYVAAVGIQFLKAYWIEVLNSLLTVDYVGYSPQFLVMWATPTWQLASSKPGESLL